MHLDRPLDTILASGGHVRVLRALEQLPAGFAASGRDLARRAGISHPRASQVLESLSRVSVVRVTRAPRADLYRLNPDHVLAASLRALFEQEAHVRQELLLHIRRALSDRGDAIRQALLFGSVARGDLDDASDIDLALVVPKGVEQAVEGLVNELAEGVEARFGSRLSVVVGSPSIDRLTQPGRPGRSLWLRIKEEGLDVLREEPARP